MALSKYKRTQAGNTFKSIQRESMPSVNRKSGSREMSVIQAASKKRSSKEEQSFLQNLKLGLNEGKLGDVSYYNTLADYYDKKLSTESDPLEQVKLQNKIFTYMNAAQNAAESSGKKAESAATKVANAEYRDLQAEIRDVKSDIFLGKLQNGAYRSTAEFVDDVQKLFAAEASALSEVVGDSRFSDSAKDSAASRLDEMKEQFENPRGTGDYGGLKYKLENKDAFVMVQKQGGQFPGGVELEFHPEFKGVDTAGDWIRGEDQLWRKAEPLVKENQLTGEISFSDPETGREESITVEDERWQKYRGKKAVKIFDPFDPQKTVTWMSPGGDGKWEAIGGNYTGIKADRPSFNPKIPVNEQPRNFGTISNLSTTPFLAGGPAFMATGFDDRGKPVFEDGQPKTPFQLSQEGPELVDTQFKEPKFERKKLPTGKYQFLKDSSPVSVDDYMKGTGMNREDALRGEEDVAGKPLSLMRGASSAASKGFKDFKGYFKNFFG